MSLRQLIATHVVQELIMRVLTALSSISTGIPEDTIKALIEKEVAKLGTFNFMSHSSLAVIVSRLHDQALLVQQTDISDEEAYRMARDGDEQTSTELGEVALKIAQSVGYFIKTLRFDMPEMVDALAGDIEAMADSTVADHDIRTRTPANVFTWGRLGSEAFVSQIVEFAAETKNCMKGETYTFNECEIMISAMRSTLYAYDPALAERAQCAEAILSQFEEDGVPESTSQEAINMAVKAATDRAYMSGIIDNIAFECIGRGTSSHIVNVITTLDMLYSALPIVEASLMPLTEDGKGADVEILKARIASLIDVVKYAYAACHIARNLRYSNIFLIASLQLTESSDAPKGKDIYINGDTVQAYLSALNTVRGEGEDVLTVDDARMDGTVLYHYAYLISLSLIGSTGITVTTAVNSRNTAYAKVDEASAAAESEANNAVKAAMYHAFDKVMRAKLPEYYAEDAAKKHIYEARHEKAVNKFVTMINAGDMAVADAVTGYILEVQGNPTLVEFYENVRGAMIDRVASDGNPDMIRKEALCVASAKLIVNFISATAISQSQAAA